MECIAPGGVDDLRTAQASCPYCGETLELVVDLSAGSQRYIEDCAVCCHPIAVDLALEADGRVVVDLRQEAD